MYAQFSDEPDAPGPDPAETEPKVNFGTTGEDSQPSKSPQIATVARSDTNVTSNKRKLNFAVSKFAIMGAVVITVVLILTVANFVLLMETRSQIFSENKIFGMSKTSLAKLRGQCHISSQAKCFYVIYRAGIEFTDAKRICAANEASPANIYSNNHFAQIAAYLRKTKIGSGESVWLGMTYNESKALYREDNGEVKYDMKWFRARGYPKSESGLDRIGFHYGLTTSSNGFINKDARAKLHGVLCEVGNE